MQTTKVGIREFRENLANYLESTTPVAITRHGATIGIFVPTKPKPSQADLDALRLAGQKMQQLVAAAGTSEDDYLRLGASLDRVTDIAEGFGLTASYHPHLTTIVENPDEISKIMDLTRIGFCPDTAHLAAGGGDPAAVIRAHSDRIRHVHLKDFRLEPFQFLPLGEGDLDFPDIIRAVQESGYDSWLLVELDSYDGDPRRAAEISKTYLDRLLAV